MLLHGVYLLCPVFNQSSANNPTNFGLILLWGRASKIEANVRVSLLWKVPRLCQSESFLF